MQKLLWKTSFVAVGIATLLSPLASSASQLTQAQVNAIIGLLQSFGADASVVANVQASLTGGSETVPPTQQWCHTFNTNLKIGDQDHQDPSSVERGEIFTLNTVLQKEGFNSVDIYSDNSNASPSFKELTASAVIAFQEKYRDEILTPNGLTHGTGYVGPSTRKKLNKLYGCVKPPVTFCTQEAKQCPDGSYVSRTGPSCAFAACPTTQASIKVLSPNGGESWAKGTTQVIKWQDNTVYPACPAGAQCSPQISGMPQMQKAFDIKLVSYRAPCTGNICNDAFLVPPTIAKGVYGYSYSWPVGQVNHSYSIQQSDTNIIASDGSYTVQVCVSGTDVCDLSDNPFSIVAQ